MTVKGNQKTLHRQIRSQFQGKRHIPFVADIHEVGHGRDIAWTLRTAAMTLLRLAGLLSIRTGLRAVMHDITALLTMAQRRPEPTPG